MNVAWGAVLGVLSLLCWGGQVLSWLAPKQATRLGLVEAEDDVEPAYWADIRGEAAWDAMTLWTMAVAGVLLVIDADAWAYFGMVGGGMYLYFAGRGILTRLEMRRRGFRVGAARNVKVGYLFLTIWGAMAAVTMVAASVALAR